MREIKFRAWDNESDKIVFQQDMNSGLDNKEYFFSLSEDNVELLHYDEDYSAYVRCDSIIMQYTGLKDVNGKEIYEGDVIEITNRTPIANLYGKVDLGIVNFENGSFLLKRKEDSLNMFNNSIITMYSYKILGNIYENRDFLILFGEKI